MINTVNFLTHIFGSQIAIGLDYIQLLLENPNRPLPAIILQSAENNTGKSTFIKYMQQLVGDAAIILSPEELQSPYNSGWAQKQLIMCDEANMSCEVLKNLLPAKQIAVNERGKTSRVVAFNAKFILASNRPEKPIGCRAWLINMQVAKDINLNLQADLTAEIPAFKKHLATRELSDNCPFI